MSTRKSDPAIAAATGWSGRFSEPVAELVKRYTASVNFDKRLDNADIAGSLAHAHARGGVPRADLAAIERGLWRLP
jgi:argininosuccinate lyase